MFVLFSPLLLLVLLVHSWMKTVEIPKPNTHEPMSHPVMQEQVNEPEENIKEEQGYTMTDQDVLYRKQREYMRTNHW